MHTPLLAKPLASHDVLFYTIGLHSLSPLGEVDHLASALNTVQVRRPFKYASFPPALLDEVDPGGSREGRPAPRPRPPMPDVSVPLRMSRAPS